MSEEKKKPHPGTENLIPLNKRTKEEQKEIVTKGGIASGAARALKKKLCESLGDELTEEKRAEISKALIKQAKKGNVRAYEVIRDTIGEKPTERIEADMSLTVKVNYGSDGSG